jgi:hypothetical protein
MVLDFHNALFSDCVPRWFARLHAVVSEVKALQKLWTNEKVHPYVSVLQTPLLVDLQQKVGELVFSRNFLSFHWYTGS